MKLRNLIQLIFFFQAIFSQSINGFVRDDANGEPLSFVNVFIKDFEIGTSTNQEGYFVLQNIPKGEISIIASIIGYELSEKNISINSKQNYRIEFRLPISHLKGEKVNVSGIRQSFKNWAEPSRVTLDFRDIKVAPAFVEADVFRTLQNLPGVQTLNDFSSALYVRGSTPDQNLIMLDGITIYNPFHLGGVFSTFNTDAIKFSDFHAGGFSAKYGGRMGSILNIVNREGNTEKITGVANISLISSKLLLEGPIPEKLGIKGSWMIAGRRTYFDIFANMIWKVYKKNNQDELQGEPDEIFPYYFYDIEAKINLDINANNRIILSQFYGDDIIDFEHTESYEYDDEKFTNTNIFDWRWGNHSNSITWRYIARPDLVFKTIYANSRFKFWIDMDNYQNRTNYNESNNSTSNEFEFDVFDIVNDYTFEANFIHQGFYNHKISGGFQHKMVDFDLGMEFHIENDGDTLNHRPLDMRSLTSESSFYMEDKWRINSLLTLQYGLRSIYYNIHKKTYYDPRLSFRYNISPDIALKLNVGRYHQFLTIANPQDENFRFIDIWMGLREDLLANFADNTIIGFDYLSNDDILYRAEAYYKHFENLVTLKQGNPFVEDGDLFNIEVFNEFWNTDAFAYGMEFLIKKNSGKVKGWFGYTFAKTMKRTDLWEWYSPKFDRTHTINIVADWELTSTLHFSTTVNLSSGNPYTPIIGQIINWEESSWNTDMEWWENEEYLVGDKNSERFPLYFRWDIGFIRESTLFGFDAEYYLQIINVTNHMNPFMNYFNKKYDSNTREYLGVERINIPMFPFLPTFGVRFEL